MSDSTKTINIIDTRIITISMGFLNFDKNYILDRNSAMKSNSHPNDVWRTHVEEGTSCMIVSPLSHVPDYQPQSMGDDIGLRTQESD